MLMFAKNSLQSFVYDVIGVFCFPANEVKEFYQQSRIIKCFIYLILTDTDICFLQFLFVWNSRSNISEKESRNLIFKILLQSKLKERLDTSDKFYDQFGCRNTNLQIQVGLYAVESIDNPNIITVAVNPKEYFEYFRDKKFNKKHKGIRKDTRAMTFEAYAERITDLK